MNIYKNSMAHHYLILLSMLYIICIVLGYTFANKEMHFPFFGTGSPGVLILPLSFTITDIIAEVYGYNIAKQVIWSGLIIQAFYCFIGAAFAYIPDPGSNIPAFTAAKSYEDVFGILPRTFIAGFLATLLGIFINTYLISKWKKMLRGKYFWLRSIASSGIGEAIFTFIGVFLICVGRFPIKIIFDFVLVSYLMKFISTIIYSYPANIVASLLKRNSKEYQNISAEYNPFKHPLGE